MKKLFAILMATLVVCGLCVAPAFADITNTSELKDWEHGGILETEFDIPDAPGDYEFHLYTAEEFTSDCDQSTKEAAQAQLEKAKSEVPEGAIIDDCGIYHNYYSTSGGTYTAGMSKEIVQKHTDKYGMYPGKVIDSMYETWAPVPGSQTYIDDLVMSEKIGFTYHITFTDGSVGEYTTYQLYKYIYPKYGYWIKWHMPDPEPVISDPVEPEPIIVNPDPVTPTPVDPVIPEESNNDEPNSIPVGPEPDPAPVVSSDVVVPDSPEQTVEVKIANTETPAGQSLMPKTGDSFGDMDSIIAIITAVCLAILFEELCRKVEEEE